MCDFLFAHWSIIDLVFLFFLLCVCFSFSISLRYKLSSTCLSFLFVLLKGSLTCWPRGQFAKPRSLFVEQRIFFHLANKPQLTDDAMQIDVHKTLYPFYAPKKMPYVTVTVTKMLCWQKCFVFTHAFFSHGIKTCITAALSCCITCQDVCGVISHRQINS